MLLRLWPRSGEAHDVPNRERAASSDGPDLEIIINRTYVEVYREVSEWLKELAWKACIPNGIVGSNPILSAK